MRPILETVILIGSFMAAERMPRGGVRTDKKRKMAHPWEIKKADHVGYAWERHTKGGKREREKPSDSNQRAMLHGGGGVNGGSTCP